MFPGLNPPSETGLCMKGSRLLYYLLLYYLLLIYYAFPVPVLPFKQKKEKFHFRLVL